ncbi:hypothetical protein SAMN05428988_1580 [Chitinophaga sp. YR573]|uniref:hypothetical protein n=1 Tax=Chitinophaga sp. YR573 TaxID=1881040 RepID=UPI0008C61F5F|nr:hypothetical protein [Chitinophaga sp. YR573]SEW04953.1 hypothetical protein SAMN05428988_1580 [Chitinophaga sp. YR573]
MKTRFILIILTVVTVFYSCKKSESSKPTPVVVTGEKVKLSIRLNGDITTSQTPFPGTRLSNKNYASAKDLNDSTIYAIDVRGTYDGSLYAQGIFNTPDNIMLEIPKGINYTIKVAAFKKGTSIGLWWGIMSPGYQYFERPLYRTLKNEMVYNSDVPNSPEALDYRFLDTLSYMTVRGDIIFDIREEYLYSEQDSYYGTTNYIATDSSSSFINIALKRISFGIKYNMINYTGGTLVADYDGLMRPRYINTYNLTDNLDIYTADTYRWQDTFFNGQRIHLTLKWQRDDGAEVLLGDTYLSPSRNSLTTVNVTMPQSNAVKAVIQLTDTAWLGNNYVDF